MRIYFQGTEIMNISCVSQHNDELFIDENDRIRNISATIPSITSKDDISDCGGNDKVNYK